MLTKPANGNTYRCTVPNCEGCSVTGQGRRHREFHTFCDRNPQGITEFWPESPEDAPKPPGTSYFITKIARDVVYSRKVVEEDDDDD